MWKIPLFDLSFDEKEKNAVLEVLDSKWLSTGPKTAEFESKFAQYLGDGDTRCCAVANGTAALHMALLMAGVQSGDEVIISGLTFVADLNVTVLTGAVPIIADCKSLDDWNVSVKDIEAKISPRTKAMIVVHYAGYPCDMQEIMDLAERHNIVVIEDAAHAIGAEYQGRKCGAIADIGCFSFFSNKNLATGEGGMVVCKTEELDKKARSLRSHGMTSMTIQRHSGTVISYDVLEPGLNYRFDEIRAALGLVQLEKLDTSNAKRGALVAKYIETLQILKNVVIPWNDGYEHGKSSFHIFPILLPADVDRIEVVKQIQQKGIQTSIHYPAFSQFTYYHDKLNCHVPIAEEISKRVLTLPLYPGMEFDDVELIVSSLGEILNGMQ
ncbi:DegT/DnrJ/EryC1/StrS aminotransferase family protein [Pelosinus sp. UFO1]|uniref:DegT/DnrJ/EryC1/StrS family aminotransferase n=1 Tax=Pelosinus sp. UFO1 TaxID=484770 RepID=UPI0004D1538C|nr:DegT/DnrJ/EryC1/StrS family aminotransferase [Pelosinus sp. UFO1]AIF53644.1 Glutamine--scyllo-inositol transaminase [Pelosinus sp. UFO1]